MSLDLKMDRRSFLKTAAMAGAGVALASYIPGVKAANAAPFISPTTATQTASAPPVVPNFAEVIDVDEGIELMLAAFAANGIERIYFHGGTDTAFFMNAVEKFKLEAKPTPEIIMSTDEAVGLNMAMGEYHYTNKPQLYIAHVALGLMQPGGSWEEAWKSECGIVAVAGRSSQLTNQELGLPEAYVLEQQRTGIQFQQEIYHQENMLGCYKKWSYDIERVENAALIINRAFQMAGSEPCGVSVLTYPLEVATAPLDGGLLYDPVAWAPATGTQGDPNALEEAAELLVNADNPLVIVKKMGRHPEAVAPFTALVERLALPVTANTGYMNISPAHWSLGNGRHSQNGRDVILVIDDPTPWTTTNPAPTTTIISMDNDPMRFRYPMSDIPVHIPISCNSALALPKLLELCEPLITPARQDVFDARQAALASAKAAADAAYEDQIESVKKNDPISDAWVGYCINEIVDENTVVTHDLSRGLGGRLPNIIQPGHVLPRISTNLGTNWGKAIGVKLAAPEKTVIATGGDGCTLFACPTACLQVQRQFNAPVLYCIHNNHEHKAVGDTMRRWYGNDCPGNLAGSIGSMIEPSPDFAAIAEAMDAYGEKVTQWNQVQNALNRALDAVHDGQAAVLDFVTVEE